MAAIEQMSRPQLNTWIKNLEESLRKDTDPRNKWIYEKWLKEAKDEQEARISRRENYLKLVGKL